MTTELCFICLRWVAPLSPYASVLQVLLLLPVNFCGIVLFRLATLLASLSSSRARSVPIWVLDVWLSSVWQQQSERVSATRKWRPLLEYHEYRDCAELQLSTCQSFWDYKWSKKTKTKKTRQLLESRWEEQDINLRSEAPLTSLPGAFLLHQCRRGDHRMRMYFLTTTALSGINLRHLVTTEAEHCLRVATVQLSCQYVKAFLGGGCRPGVCTFVCLPYIFGFPFAATDMRSGLHSAESPHHSSHNLFSRNDGLTAISLLI